MSRSAASQAAPERRRRGRPQAVRLLPSVITILALSAGLSAVKFALDGQLGTALGMIGAAAVLDSLDGRIARLLDATTKIGAELDSLSDAVAFGVAPALVLYVTLLDGSPFGWIVALLYAVSIVLRLARFNTLLEDDTVPAYAREYFVGVPSPPVPSSPWHRSPPTSSGATAGGTPTRWWPSGRCSPPPSSSVRSRPWR